MYVHSLYMNHITTNVRLSQFKRNFTWQIQSSCRHVECGISSTNYISCALLFSFASVRMSGLSVYICGAVSDWCPRPYEDWVIMTFLSLTI